MTGNIGWDNTDIFVIPQEKIIAAGYASFYHVKNLHKVNLNWFIRNINSDNEIRFRYLNITLLRVHKILMIWTDDRFIFWSSSTTDIMSIKMLKIYLVSRFYFVGILYFCTSTCPPPQLWLKCFNKNATHCHFTFFLWSS